MIAFIVCVDYCDLLKITLPHNLHHFDKVVVVTSHQDEATIDYVLYESKPQHGSRVGLVMTNAFYEYGALFNKWKALDQALKECAEGWICLLDADILLPHKFKLDLEVGKLYSPFRRMVNHNGPHVVPTDSEFKQYERHNDKEFAGYCQIFHSKDPVLGAHPWHQQNWKHAGGADTFFEMKWTDENKVRPDFDVLHFGVPEQNWAGVGNELKLRAMIAQRKGPSKSLERYRNEMI
jgi:hypothetical protein